MKTKYKIIIFVSVVVSLCVVLGVVFLNNKMPSDMMPINMGTVQKNTDSISIPGYESLTLEAGRKQQTISLNNPAQNCCYFQISLTLKDGTILWQSDLISPGEQSTPMLLSKELSKGTYTEAKLIYHCFQMNDDLTSLNGAETKLTLIVK